MGAPEKACSSSGRAPVLSKREQGSPSAIKEGEMEGQPCRMQGVCGSEQAGMKAANDTLNLLPPGVVVLRPHKYK